MTTFFKIAFFSLIVFSSISLSFAEQKTQNNKVDPEHWYAEGMKFGKAKNGEKAVEFLSKAADSGHTKASYALGWLYYYGQLVELDYNKAAKLFLSAAEKGLPEAQNMMSILYSKGQGVKMDRTVAFSWLKKASQSGHKGAQSAINKLPSAKPKEEPKPASKP